MEKKKYMGMFPDIRVKGRWVQTYTDSEGVYNTVSGSLWRGLRARTKRNKGSYERSIILFKDFNEFVEWNRGQTNYCKSGYHLDKDLFWDNNTYSLKTCRLIPANLNILMQGIGLWRNGKLVGASRDRRFTSKWRATGFKQYKQIWLGVYDSEIDAHNQWRINKANILEEYMNKVILDDDIAIGIRRVVDDLRAGLSGVKEYRGSV